MAGRTKSKRRKTPAGVIIKKLPPRLRPPLNNDKLKDLTFKDLDTITQQLEKFSKQDPQAYYSDACGLTTKWGG
ncbi:MAG TPA: hypothetical protein VGQ08_08625 [Nitrospiraceae bacterium]|jgi:hypothetical protein|nr:hypothetical protein [Nitrospiraceae bacterium]